MLQMPVTRASAASQRVSNAPDSRNTALCTPLTLTGTPDELDRELAGVLTEYVDTLGKFRHSLADVKLRMEEAVKTVEADGKKKIEEAKKSANLKTPRNATAGKAPDPEK